MTSTLDAGGPRDPAVDLPPLPPAFQATGSPPAPGPGETVRFPLLAAFLAAVPGLGHLYVGAYQKATMIVIGIIAICIVVPLPINVFLALFVWFFGIFDAYRQAQLQNLRGRGAALPTASDDQGGLAFGVFLTVVGALLLLRNFGLIELEWLRDWWPVIPLLVGLYLIGSAVLQRRQRSAAAVTAEDLGDERGA
jgi:4-hydroxybenzoate polyprenyltransferase